MMDKRVKLPVRAARLEFAGTDYEGIVVRVRLNVPLKTMLQIQEFRDNVSAKATSATEVTVDLKDTADSMVEALKLFGRAVLLEWNLEDDNGAPIPVGEEGILAVDVLFAMQIMSHWMEAVSQPPAPLAVPSANGSTSAEPSEPTGELLASLGALSRPSS